MADSSGAVAEAIVGWARLMNRCQIMGVATILPPATKSSQSGTIVLLVSLLVPASKWYIDKSAVVACTHI